SESGLLHALEQIEAEGGLSARFVFLQCTSPLLQAEDIDGSLAHFEAESADSLFSGARFFHFVWQADPHGGMIGVNHDKTSRPRRQDREAQWVENGALYVLDTAGFRKAQHRFFGKTACYAMPPERALEIDEPLDLLLAETAARAADTRARLDLLPERPRALIMDFDGVFTDNRVLVSESGEEAVTCSRGDGMGLDILRKFTDLRLCVISKEKNKVVKARCDKLQLECAHGIEDKLTLLRAWLDERGLDPADCVYLGNDLNDIAPLSYVGCGAVVADALSQPRAHAQLVLTHPGGHGAIRELCELLLERLDINPEGTLPGSLPWTAQQ
ncbi:MAG: acylneuraminate cytidylyltransferase, partial [Verrucomicrobiota bacterium]